MMAPHSPGVACVASDTAGAVARAFAEGLGVDQASWLAGYESGGQSREGARECPAGLDMFSFHLGAAAARRYGGAKR